MGTDEKADALEAEFRADIRDSLRVISTKQDRTLALSTRNGQRLEDVSRALMDHATEDNRRFAAVHERLNKHEALLPAPRIGLARHVVAVVVAVLTVAGTVAAAWLGTR